MQAQSTPPERKYVLTRIGAGDYLLPSNDGKALWRIATYTDGPSSGLMDWPRDREVWGYWKYVLSLPPDRVLNEDFLDWERWDPWGTAFETRRDAIDAALREDA